MLAAGLVDMEACSCADLNLLAEMPLAMSGGIGFIHPMR